MDPETVTARAAASCAARCSWTHCTGTGSTHYSAHVCAMAPAELDPHPCTLCGAPASLLPAGWRCPDHRAATPEPDPTLTAAALHRRELDAVFPRPIAYGSATTPRPRREHTCRRDRPATRADCPACQLEADGWQQLLASFRSELLA